MPEQAVTLMSVEPSLNAAPPDDAVLVPSSSSSPSSSSNSSSQAQPQAAAAAAQAQQRGHAAPQQPHARPVDMVVAKRRVRAGEVVLRIPERLVVTLDRIFESEFVGACAALRGRGSAAGAAAAASREEQAEGPQQCVWLCVRVQTQPNC